MRVFLCEKPSQGKDIARVLGATERGEGCFRSPSALVTWCIGHLIEAAPPEAYGEQYKRWTLEQLPIVPERWKVEVKASTAAQFKLVQKYLRAASEVVIATDADREGEMIAHEILDLCGYRGPVQRLWLSALNDASIRKALDALRRGAETLPLYHAALARSRADWLVGMNLSRLFTLLGQRAGFQGVLSVGRVQTPTVQLVVQRDREIASFVPAPYWSIDVGLSARDASFTAHWLAPKGAVDEADRCVQVIVAERAAQNLHGAREAHVTMLTTERVREPPPLPFDLSTLQETCSRQLGLDVQETLSIAQALYETHKATTYPRTDCGYLPESMLADVPRVLDALRATDPSIAALLATLDRTLRSRAWNDSKVSAHHGIIPTLEPANMRGMSEKEAAVYRLIRAHYLAQFLPAHEYDRTVAQLTCASETLRASGKRIQVRGWRSVFPGAHERDEDGDSPSQVLPALTEGERCGISRVDIKAQKTQAPKPYTQGELVKAMKCIARFVSDPRLKEQLRESGIGTEATRGPTIQGLIARGYLLKTGRALRASQSAQTLIDAVPPAVADPVTTAVWEQALDLVAQGRLSPDAFVRKQEEWVRQLVRDYMQRSITLATARPAKSNTSARRSRVSRSRSH